MRHLLTLRIGAKGGRFGSIAPAPRAASHVVPDRAIYRMNTNLFMDIGGSPMTLKDGLIFGGILFFFIFIALWMFNERQKFEDACASFGGVVSDQTWTCLTRESAMKVTP